MNKYFVFFVAAALSFAAAITSCKKDKDVETDNKPSQQITTITAGIPDGEGSELKLTLQGVAKNEVRWTVGDKIYVAEVSGTTFDATYGLSAFTCTSVATGGKSGTFVMDAGQKPLTVGRTYVAAHVGNFTTAITSGQIAHTIPHTLTQNGAGEYASIDRELLFISAPVAATASGAAFAFSHLMSLLEFDVWTDDVAHFSAFAIDRITVATAATTSFVTGLRFAASGTGNPVNATTGTLTMNLRQPAGGTSRYTLDATKRKVRIPLMWNPAVTAPTGDFTITLHPASGSAITFTRPAKKLDAGQIYSMDLKVVAPVSPPVINTHPANQTVTAGGTATFSVTATNVDSYRWQMSVDNGSYWSNISTVTIPSAATATLSVNVSAGMNGYQYRCIVTNAGGFTTSNPATLTVTTPPPVITAHPANTTAAVGGTATFSITATNVDSYRWQMSVDNGSYWSNISTVTIPSAATATLSVNVSAGMNGYQYRCIVTNEGGFTTSNAATLTVTSAKTVTVGAQAGTMTAGVRSMEVTFPVTTTGIAAGNYNVQTSVANLPAGVLVGGVQSRVTIDAAGKGTLTLISAPTSALGPLTVAGTYTNLTLTLDGVTSPPFTLVITEPTPGTAANPFKVTNLTDLQRVGTGTSGWTTSAHYLQTATIDLTSVSNFTALGGVYGLSGSYDGGGYSIINLKISKTSVTHQGLFEVIAVGGVVKNVALVNAIITAAEYVGGIAGDNKGTIQNCYVSGSITATGAAGGITGYNPGTVENCYTTCTVSGNASNTGGIAGVNSNAASLINNCYVTGNVSGNRYSGGITGYNLGRVFNSVALSYRVSITGNYPQVGKITGDNFGTLTNNHSVVRVFQNSAGNVTPSYGTNQKDGIQSTGAQVESRTWWIGTANFSTTNWEILDGGGGLPHLRTTNAPTGQTGFNQTQTPKILHE